MQIYQKIRSFAKKHASSNNAFSSFLVFLYKAFISEFTRVLISIIGTIVIGVMFAIKYFGFWFVIAIVIYVALLFLSAISNKYKAEKVLETKMLHQSLYGVSQILYSWSICLQ